MDNVLCYLYMPECLIRWLVFQFVMRKFHGDLVGWDLGLCFISPHNENRNQNIRVKET
jgi:hypothetical protein